MFTSLCVIVAPFYAIFITYLCHFYVLFTSLRYRYAIFASYLRPLYVLFTSFAYLSLGMLQVCSLRFPSV